jgi:hypothetical protein
MGNLVCQARRRREIATPVSLSSERFDRARCKNCQATYGSMCTHVMGYLIASTQPLDRRKIELWRQTR